MPYIYGVVSENRTVEEMTTVSYQPVNDKLGCLIYP
jgi:hypothetical protein